jgi:hypothetical protein
MQAAGAFQQRYQPPRFLLIRSRASRARPVAKMAGGKVPMSRFEADTDLEAAYRAMASRLEVGPVCRGLPALLPAHAPPRRPFALPQINMLHASIAGRACAPG